MKRLFKLLTAVDFLAGVIGLGMALVACQFGRTPKDGVVGATMALTLTFAWCLVRRRLR